MTYWDEIREHRDSFIRGATLVLGGAALILVATLIGLGEGKWLAVAAGTIGVTGVCVIFLGFFVYVVPPLLPAK